MSGKLSTPVQNFEDLRHALSVLCESTTPVELFGHLTKTLHELSGHQPVALYRRLNTGNLRLAYCYPLESTLASQKALLTIRSLDELAASEFQYYELKGEHQVWGYIGHPPSTYSEPIHWIRLLIDIAAQRLRLLKAERMAVRQLALKTRRQLLSKDIKRLSSIDDILQHHGHSWCEIFQADGIAMAYQAELYCYGECPSQYSLFQQLLNLNKHKLLDDITELEGDCQGGLAVQLSLATTTLGWLILFRRQPLVCSSAADIALQTSFSYWMPLEASMIVELADDLAVAITAFDVVHLNRQLTKTNQRLEGLVHTDPLTQCWNRYYTELIIENLCSSGEEYAVLMFDLDNFKQINDAYGHAVGDEILRQMVPIAKRSIRSNDHLGRWGGEEFIIIAKGLCQEEGWKLANRLCENVAQHAFPIPATVTISVGVTTMQPNDTPLVLLERTDKGMYRAKNAGKNQVMLC
ncbi:hypothetical protein LCGC14_0072960 [marine sediment metagenome]|uniref:GGDEF domain-containing protein n=1 Tax=marine sediment metagenome TaxID=412755 RepID=A0A0F9VKL2_9ZZZZ|nr:GGDEF domain-containing protein [Halomonas sp.]HDZ48935.1 GGDEF domain-containing protein [Halomonas sp.]HEB06313.1 GGDEF domain-containing protein [Halomonas sp.]